MNDQIHAYSWVQECLTLGTLLFNHPVVDFTRNQPIRTILGEGGKGELESAPPSCKVGKVVAQVL